TAAAVRELIREELEARFAEGAAPRIGVCSNPEFLKEGAAVADFTHGERIVIGVEDARDEETMRTLYAPFNRQRDKIIVMDPASAELTKYAANALLATKISFMNEMAGIAEATGADIERVRLGVGSDPRIGYPFLYAGAGYGGSCFPKDVAALAHTARAVGVDPGLLEAGMRVNERQKERLGQKLAELLPDPEGARVAVWGLSFKPRTDDVREAPSLALVERLLAAGCRVRAYDPAAGDTFAAALAARLGVRELPEAYQPALTREDALEGADALVVCTEWEQFRAFDAQLLTSRMAGRVIVDGRNLWDPEQVAAAGFAYASIGRVTTRPSAAPDRD
ncbi:UDP-glucose 6-dehydrogenase, partial [Rothia kristinae]